MTSLITLTHPEDSDREFHAGDSYNRSGPVDDADIERAISAAVAVLREAGVAPEDAEEVYFNEWIQFGDEAWMSGLALLWIEAREAANRALTETWATRSNLGVGLSAV